MVGDPASSMPIINRHLRALCTAHPSLPPEATVPIMKSAFEKNHSSLKKKKKSSNPERPSKRSRPAPPALAGWGWVARLLPGPRRRQRAGARRAGVLATPERASAREASRPAELSPSARVPRPPGARQFCRRLVR